MGYLSGTTILWELIHFSIFIQKRTVQMIFCINLLQFNCGVRVCVFLDKFSGTKKDAILRSHITPKLQLIHTEQLQRYINFLLPIHDPRNRCKSESHIFNIST